MTTVDKADKQDAQDFVSRSNVEFNLRKIDRNPFPPRTSCELKLEPIDQFRGKNPKPWLSNKMKTALQIVFICSLFVLGIVLGHI